MAVAIPEIADRTSELRRLIKPNKLGPIMAVLPDRGYCEGGHIYQPPRRVYHWKFSAQVNPDPFNRDWTERLAPRYRDLAETGALEQVSYDLAPTLVFEFERVDPELAQMYKAHLAKNGAGSFFIHRMGPETPDAHLEVNIGAGVEQFRKFSGVYPSRLFPPEAGIDHRVAKLAYKYGYEAIIGAPWQARRLNPEYGVDPNFDDIPKQIKYDTGEEIVFLPYNRRISSQISFQPIHNADEFAAKEIGPHLNGRVVLTYKDIERYNLHWKDLQTGEYLYGERFLEWLVKSSIPNIVKGRMVSINQIDLSHAVPGAINPWTAWSCLDAKPSEKVGEPGKWRWNQVDDDCHIRQDGSKPDTTWKEPFSEAHRKLGDAILDVVQERMVKMGLDYVSTMIKDAEAAYRNPGVDVNGNKFLSLESADMWGQAANTSCATYFETPETSGGISIASAGIALVYLLEGGEKRNANLIRTDYLARLKRVPIIDNFNSMEMYNRMYGAAA